jgi:hypothetical protein
VLAGPPGYGYELRQRLTQQAAASSASTRVRCIPRCIGWSEPCSSRARRARSTHGGGASIGSPTGSRTVDEACRERRAFSAAVGEVLG